MFIGANSLAVRFTGRWDINENRAVTTATASSIEIAYKGKDALLEFDVSHYSHPFPHIWIILDNGGKIETAVDRFIRIEANEEGNHLIKIIFKSAVEVHHRWYEPLVGKVEFLGLTADGEGILPEDNRKIIEFIGDSITEGVLIDEPLKSDQIAQEYLNRPYQDDSTATYAYLTAQALDMRIVSMGYGAVGATKEGNACVPKAADSYPYNFFGSPYNGVGADIIVINHGANDMRNTAENYTAEYENLLKVVRKINPSSKIAVLSAFYGVYPEELKATVEKFNKETGDNVYFIDSTGWIAKEPLHPLRDGHITVAKNLTEKLKEIL